MLWDFTRCRVCGCCSGFSAGSVARSVLFKLMCCCSCRLLLASLVAPSAFLVSAVATRPRHMELGGVGRGLGGRVVFVVVVACCCPKKKNKSNKKKAFQKVVGDQ